MYVHPPWAPCSRIYSSTRPLPNHQASCPPQSTPVYFLTAPTPLYLTVTPFLPPHWLSQVDTASRGAGRLQCPHGGDRSSWAWGQSKRAPPQFSATSLPTYQPEASTFMVGGAVRGGTAAGLGGSHPLVGQLLLPVRRTQNTQEVRREQGPVCTSPSPLSAAGLKDTG